MSTATDTLDRRDAIDVAAVVIMLVLTFSWGLNGVAANSPTPASTRCF